MLHLISRVTASIASAAMWALLRFSPNTASRLWSRWRFLNKHYPRLFRELDFTTTLSLENGYTISCRFNDYIERRLILNGRWESHILSILHSTLRPGDVFVDVGAHIGIFSLSASTIVGADGLVIAIEASPRTYVRLTANIARNCCDNILPLNIGLWDAPTLTRIEERELGNSGSATVRGNHNIGSMTLLARLDDLLPPELGSQVRVIKIDIEGAEPMALKGMRKLLQSEEPPWLLFEVNPHFLREIDKDPFELFSELRAYGYRLLYSLTEGSDNAYWKEIDEDIPATNPVDVCAVPNWVSHDTIRALTHQERLTCVSAS